MLSVADRMAIMYASEMVEIGDIKSIFEELLHPYTRTLIDALPSYKKRNIHQRIHRTKRKRIKRIPIDKAVNTTTDALTSLRNASIEKSLY
jgi:ABC-type dipeptide/oligopeptide/nickel transport system ATPase component